MHPAHLESNYCTLTLQLVNLKALELLEISDSVEVQQQKLDLLIFLPDSSPGQVSSQNLHIPLSVRKLALI